MAHCLPILAGVCLFFFVEVLMGDIFSFAYLVYMLFTPSLLVQRINQPTYQPQVDDDMSGVVWERMDKADPRSPLPSLSLPFGKKTKRKGGAGAGAGGGNGGGYTRVEQEQADVDAAAAEEAAAADQYRLLWRMWRVTKPLVISQGLWQLVATLTEFVPSLAMQQIIDFVSAYHKGEGGVTGRITLFVVLLFVGPLLQGVADGRNFHIGRRIGCRVS